MPYEVAISLILVNHQTPGDVARLLGSLTAHPPSCSWEVIVVNTVPAGAYARAEADTHLQILQMDSNRGFGAAVNRGIQEARGEFIMPLNADLIFQDDCLPSLVSQLRTHKNIGILLPRLRSPDGTLQYNARTFYTWWTILCRRTPLGKFAPGVSRAHLYQERNHEEAFDTDWGLGAALVARRELLQDERLYDERFFLYFEDVDLCTRAWQAGYRVQYFPPATLVHDHQRGSAASVFSRPARTHLKSLRLYHKKHGGLRPTLPTERRG